MKIKDKHYKYRGMVNISMAVNETARPLFIKRGFAENRIITDWNLIAGEHIGKFSNPRRLSFRQNTSSDGTLFVEVYNSISAMEMEHLAPVIIEKISLYFGYKAVNKIKIIQNPGGGSRVENKDFYRKEPRLSEAQNQKLASMLEGITDEDLKNKLASFGKYVLPE